MKKNNYRLDIMLEEWVDGRGFQIIHRTMRTKHSDLDTATNEYQKLKEFTETKNNENT